MEDTDFVVEIEDLAFGWTATNTLLDIPRASIGAGEKVFLKGPSGSGKSTLLGLLCGVLTPRTGRITVAGEDLTKLSAARRDALRADRLGVIFQLFNLVPYLSLLENVALPCGFSRDRAARACIAAGSVEGEARRLLDRLGLGDPETMGRPVSELSVGQQQRAAAARALIGAPSLIIADEPTSALDANARDAFLALLIEECAGHGSGLLFVSHDAQLADHFDRTLDLTALNRAAGPGGPS